MEKKIFGTDQSPAESAQVSQASPTLDSYDIIFGERRGAATLYGTAEKASGTEEDITVQAKLIFPNGETDFFTVGAISVPASGPINYAFNLSALDDWKLCTGIRLRFTVPTDTARVFDVIGYLLIS
ncbi:MAG: hypothetical protein KDD04_03025 [Sinomicrobium sp.]|nr:hypothetical protein [Sinomicrobium sp.]